MPAAQANQLTDWLDELARIEREVRGTLEPLSEAQFSWKPGPSRWSIGECLDHLAITGALALGNILPILALGRAEGRSGRPPFRYGLLGGWFVRTMERPGKRPMPSPANFVPPGAVAKAEALGKFFRVNRELERAIRSSEGLALDRLKAPSSARGAGWLRLNVAAWFAATLAHQRRHLAQARRVMETQGFPG
jgi:hypothetical protein